MRWEKDARFAHVLVRAFVHAFARKSMHGRFRLR
jgi:hypothetical protein